MALQEAWEEAHQHEAVLGKEPQALGTYWHWGQEGMEHWAVGHHRMGIHKVGVLGNFLLEDTEVYLGHRMMEDS